MITLSCMMCYQAMKCNIKYLKIKAVLLVILLLN